MSEIQKYLFTNSEVRVAFVDNEPWFVAVDVANALGNSNVANMLESLDEDEKLSSNIESILLDNFKSPNGTVNLVNESGIYHAAFVSRSPLAGKFRKWVTTEVIPSIRKHGVYIADELMKDKERLTSALNSALSEKNRYQHIMLTCYGGTQDKFYWVLNKLIKFANGLDRRGLPSKADELRKLVYHVDTELQTIDHQNRIDYHTKEED